MCGPTAVDGQCSPRDRRGGVASQENSQRAEFFHRGKTLIRLLCEENITDDLLARNPMRLRLAFDLRLDQGRIDVARTNGVAGDALLGRLKRRDLGQPDDTVLGRHVGRFVWRGDQAVR
jgi:hypothetical protein